MDFVFLLGGFTVGAIAGGAFMALRYWTPTFRDGCPSCGSLAVEGEAPDMMQNDEGEWLATQDIYCVQCEEQWTDVYKLIEQRRYPEHT